MQLRFIDEHNDRGHLLWAEEPVGLALRGETQQAALSKLPAELTAYRQKMEQLEREILVLSGDNNLLDNATGKVDVDVPKLLCALKDDPLHVNCLLYTSDAADD